MPHFEIMLYDLPQLIHQYLSAFQITRNIRHASVARGILDYMLRDLRHPDGGFYAAEDADSLDVSDGRKKEGQFYIWTKTEIESVLEGGDEAALFLSHYGIKSEGNCTQSPRSDPHKEFTGQNVLYQAKTLAETAKSAGKSEGEVEEMLAGAREKLFRVRARRPRPHRDEKCVTAWNGMAIGALAAAGRILESEDPPLTESRLFPVEGRSPGEYVQAATAAAAFAKKNLYDEATGQLRRAFTKGPSAVAAFSDDYAHLIAGLLELYSATGCVSHLQWALDLQKTMDDLFWDGNGDGGGGGGGYFQAAAGNASLLLRMKEDYDGAEPAASSIAVSNLWRLGALLGTEEGGALRQKAAACAAAFANQLKTVPVAMPQMATALHLLNVGHARQVVIAGRGGCDDTEALLNAAAAVYAPDKVVIHVDLGDAEVMAFWRERNPEVVAIAEMSGMTVDEPATAFICQNFTCKKPTTDLAVVEKMLKEPRGGGAVKVMVVDSGIPGMPLKTM